MSGPAQGTSTALQVGLKNVDFLLIQVLSAVFSLTLVSTTGFWAPRGVFRGCQKRACGVPVACFDDNRTALEGTRVYQWVPAAIFAACFRYLLSASGVLTACFYGLRNVLLEVYATCFLRSL